MASIGLLALVLAAVISAQAAANIVPRTALGSISIAISANSLKPDECAALNLTRVLVSHTGTNSNELILGGSGSDTMDGNGGDDCILGGAGNDTMNGGSGNDVVLSGLGDDQLRGDGGTDRCLGGSRTDTFHPSCEYTAQ